MASASNRTLAIAAGCCHRRGHGVDGLIHWYPFNQYSFHQSQIGAVPPFPTWPLPPPPGVARKLNGDEDAGIEAIFLGAVDTADGFGWAAIEGVAGGAPEEPSQYFIPGPNGINWYSSEKVFPPGTWNFGTHGVSYWGKGEARVIDAQLYRTKYVDGNNIFFPAARN